MSKIISDFVLNQLADGFSPVFIRGDDGKLLNMDAAELLENLADECRMYRTENRVRNAAAMECRTQQEQDQRQAELYRAATKLCSVSNYDFARDWDLLNNAAVGPDMFARDEPDYIIKDGKIYRQDGTCLDDLHVSLSDRVRDGVDEVTSQLAAQEVKNAVTSSIIGGSVKRALPKVNPLAESFKMASPFAKWFVKAPMKIAVSTKS